MLKTAMDFIIDLPFKCQRRVAGGGWVQHDVIRSVGGHLVQAIDQDPLEKVSAATRRVSALSRPRCGPDRTAVFFPAPTGHGERTPLRLK